MYFVKTAQGQQAFKERHQDFAQRLRSAFLLFDGKRSLNQVLEATAAMGVTQADVMSLVDKGWLQLPDVAAPGLAPAAVAQPSTSASLEPALAVTDEEQARRRYQQAYPLAVSLTGKLGLRGFRLNLAVEAAMGYAQLVELAPHIRDAAGDKAYAALHQALFAQE